MTDRAAKIAAFLDGIGWGTATRRNLAGDASNRRYERLDLNGTPAVLMDAPPDKGEDVRPFIRIGGHLKAIGLSPPEILAQDEELGFLLLEDLGDGLYARLLVADPSQELPLYLAATDALIDLHAAPLPSAPDYGPETMSDFACLATDWYAFGATGNRDTAATQTLRAAMLTAFGALPPWSPVLVLRDYHAENLLWLPARQGSARVGLLDFQDAGIGHPAYDLMSLARDARREVSPATFAAMMARYVDATGYDAEGFARACATVSAQRNLRILGVFARLSLHFGKAHYVDLIPRVWRNLQTDLSHPGLSELARSIGQLLPEPTPEILATLKAKCGTIPTL
ncbi:MAG: phosphotransferase [Maritimibacter sp.]|uniref:aminoglycoside phosphotransferase family protein n=1 Tax=Maritimibacter sp. TaxID=2003363 RepID=UPI001DC62785|nr:phosphotransferase [Maritimibacter sp.]MBL6427991.1 phosphotransferase [Maritimibacter sp.]